MIKPLTIVTICLFIVVSASSGASAQQLSAPTPALCLASASPALVQGDLFAPQPMTCGSKCYTSEGGTTPTQSALSVSGNCAAMTSDLTTRLNAAANTACRNLSGFAACNIVLSLTGCLYDGDVDYLIEYGHATYNCIDTNC
jgi:hypothetical protein